MVDTTLACSKRQLSPDNVPEQDATGRYFMLAPDGTNLTIPKELFVALSDFIKTRKCPGSITIEFRSGDIVCVEAVAKKTFRNSSNTLE